MIPESTPQQVRDRYHAQVAAHQRAAENFATSLLRQSEKVLQSADGVMDLDERMSLITKLRGFRGMQAGGEHYKRLYFPLTDLDATTPA